MTLFALVPKKTIEFDKLTHRSVNGPSCGPAQACWELTGCVKLSRGKGKLLFVNTLYINTFQSWGLCVLDIKLYPLCFCLWINKSCGVFFCCKVKAKCVFILQSVCSKIEPKTLQCSTRSVVISCAQ